MARPDRSIRGQLLGMAAVALGGGLLIYTFSGRAGAAWRQDQTPVLLGAALLVVGLYLLVRG